MFNFSSTKRIWFIFSFISIIAILFSITSKTLQSPPSPVDTNSQGLSLSTAPSTTFTPPPLYKPVTQPHNIELPAEPIHAQMVIQFAPNTTQEERTAYIESVGGTVVETIESLDTVVVTVSEEVAQEPLPESPAVTQIEQDYYVTSLDDLAPVNDPRFSEQWALPVIGAPSAWAEMPADAPQVTVAVIDSGICASHPDLAGRIVDGWDFIESDAVPQDDFGHGCSVAGVIAANMDDGIGIAGVAPNAQILPLRVLNASGVGSYSDVAAAIVYAADHGAQVINLSLGGSNPSSTLENAVNYAISKGVIVVAAAGNNGTEGALYPATYPNVIAVGSMDANLQHSSFSNYGSQIDIWAPGRDILAIKRDGSYGLVSGSSFAAPYVAGAESVEIALNRMLLLNGGMLELGSQIDLLTPTATTPPIIIPTESPAVSLTPPSATPGYYSERSNIYSFNYPVNWTITEDKYWTDSDPLTFDSFIELKSPDKEVITIRTWRNIEPSSISELSSKYLYFTLEDTAKPYGEGFINRHPMVMAIEPGIERKEPTTISTLFQCGTSVYDIKYIGYNAGSNAKASQDLLGSFNCADELKDSADSIPEISASQFVSAPSNLEGSGTTCFSFYDPTSDNNYNCGQCTWWASYSRPDIQRNWGNAYQWYNNAIQDPDFGQTMVSASPEAGAIAVWSQNKDGATGNGHVAYVTGVNTDGTFNITEMNWACSTGDGTCTAKLRSSPVSDTDNINFILGGVTFFENKEFGGQWQRTRTWKPYIDYGWGISSVFIPASWEVILYKNPNYDSSNWRERTGGQTTDALNSSFWNLQIDYYSDGSTIINDNVQSARVANTMYQCISPFGMDETFVSSEGCGPIVPTATPPSDIIDGLKLISVSSPTVQKGETFAVSITYEVENGQLLQSRGDHLFGFDPTYGAWPVQAVGGTYSPGQQVTFSFNLTAPQQTGTFESKWQLKVGGNLIGPQATVRFAVQDTSPPPTNSGPWNSQAWQNKSPTDNPNWTGQWTWSDNYPYVDFNWGTGAPFGWGGDQFSMRLWKTIHFPGGYYSFHASHDDGVKVYLDNTVILDAWWDGSGGHDIGKNIPAGDHEVKVEYYENTGDAFVNVHWYGPGFPEPDTNPPDGRITSPANQFATASSPLTISADASDDVSGVNRVEFYVQYCDGSCAWHLISTDYSMPYTTNWDWSALGDQRVLLTTHMIDNTGKVRSDPGGYVEVVLDRTKPTISIISPIDGASMNGDPITITASASDSLSGVWKLQFFAGYNETVGAGAQGIFETPPPAAKGDSGELSVVEVSAQGWHEIGWDENGANGWSLTWTPSGVPNQSGISIFVYAYDYAGNVQGAIRSNLTLSKLEPVDILLNGGVEVGDSVLLGWHSDAWTPAYSTFLWDTTKKHSGNRSIEIASSYNNDARWIQTVYVQPNSDYLLSGWIKTQIVAHSPEPNDAGANLSIMGGLERTAGVFDTTDWMYVSLPFNTGSRTQIDIAARLGMYSGTTTGIAWFDDLKLELLSVPTCYSLTKIINPIGSGVVNANPAPNCNNGAQYVHGTVVLLSAVPNTGYTFSNWEVDASIENLIYTTMTDNKSLKANFNPTSQTTATFGDVPSNHPYLTDIEILYANGLTAGCSSSPLLFCPDTVMDRAQSAVFMLRGNLGVNYAPPNPPFGSTFGDYWGPGPWAQKWAQGMLQQGLTAGCSSSPLLYCPWEAMPRLQAAVFGMRLMNGNAYVPPPATGTVFADLTDTSLWYTKWAEQAYLNGLLPACGSSGGKPLFCPNDLVSRGLGAYMIVRAKNLSMP